MSTSLTPLRIRGIDVTTTTDADLIGASDEEHLAFALEQQRVAVTRDPDFLRFHEAGEEHAGIVFCTSEKASIGDIVRHLCLIQSVLTPDEMAGQVEYL